MRGGDCDHTPRFSGGSIGCWIVWTREEKAASRNSSSLGYFLLILFTLFIPPDMATYRHRLRQGVGGWGRVSTGGLTDGVLLLTAGQFFFNCCEKDSQWFVVHLIVVSRSPLSSVFAFCAFCVCVCFFFRIGGDSDTGVQLPCAVGTSSAPRIVCFEEDFFSR